MSTPTPATVEARESVLPQLIIIEGCDHTGKSTFAEKLTSELGYNYIHYGVPPEHLTTSDDLFNYHATELARINEQLLSQGEKVVIDRFHLSNVVYGILRSNPHIDMFQFGRIEDMLSTFEAVVVYCFRDPGQLMAEILEEEDEDLTQEEVIKCLQIYPQVCRRTILPVLKRDFNFSLDAKDIKNFLTI